jgi:hypothetical protein
MHPVILRGKKTGIREIEPSEVGAPARVIGAPDVLA